MGKRKLEMRKIENEDARQVCFSKRRQGLFKKAAELCILCDAEIAILVFSQAGRSFSFGHPSADTVINRYLSGGTTPSGDFKHFAIYQLAELERKLSVEEERMRSYMVKENLIGGHMWDQVKVEDFQSVEQLESFASVLEVIRGKALARAEEVSRNAIVGPLGPVESSGLKECDEFFELLPPLDTADFSFNFDLI